MENDISIQTRAMTGAQPREDGAQKQVDDKPERVQVTNPAAVNGTGGPEVQDPAANTMRDKMEDKIIEEFTRKECSIGLDWYVPNLNNMQVRELIKE